MNNSQIKSILQSCMSQLKLVNNSVEFQKIQNSEYFGTNNDYKLGDAINAIDEVITAIKDVEIYG